MPLQGPTSVLDSLRLKKKKSRTMKEKKYGEKKSKTPLRGRKCILEVLKMIKKNFEQ